MSDRLAKYSELFRKPGPWCMAYVDASAGTVDGLEAADVQPDNVRNALAGLGASENDLEAVAGAIQPATGEPSPISRYVLVRQGEVAINELLPGALLGPEQISTDVVPDLLPLLKHRPDGFAYVVAEVSREEGEIRLHRAGRQAAEESQHIQGSDENLKKVPVGGWSQGRYQRHTEEIWRRNADQVVEQIDRVVRENSARLLVLAGDIRARQLVADQLSEASKAILSLVDSHTLAAGSDREKFEDEVNSLVAQQWATEQGQLVDRLAEQEGQANPESATGFGAVVHALQQAQVEVLMFDDGSLTDRTVLALNAEPWLATSEEESLGAEVLGKVPAAAALLRAAALTDARVELVPSAALPDGVEIAALLRWPTGPEAPAAT
ncbi:Vms1/Ankzf1 family peptidyl-tRNA hydrolase [Paenarthrobacter sp.]|uniref:baeRF2 domain-containing protein n=1 Tax=Paenarthrobacter sp. TaxID=1931993 RepID=UPI002811DB5F|nr:Vms1/Ankzf1 family peptidyl-tRNA hydrolase [Paenarthrobacter sp.]